MNWSDQFKNYCFSNKIKSLQNPSGCWSDFNNANRDIFFLKRMIYFNAADGLLNDGDLPPDPYAYDYPNNCES